MLEERPSVEDPFGLGFMETHDPWEFEGDEVHLGVARSETERVTCPARPVAKCFPVPVDIDGLSETNPIRATPGYVDM